MIRRIIGVIVAYTIFAGSAIALFQLTGTKPHAPAAIGFQITTAIYGAIFSILAGVVLQVIARTKDLAINFILAAIIAGFAAFSLIKSDGSPWTQLLAIFVFAPASVLGGFLYLRRR